MFFRKFGLQKKQPKQRPQGPFSKDPVLVRGVFDVKIFAESPQEFRLHVRGELDEVHLRRLLVEPRFCVNFLDRFFDRQKKN